MIRNCSVCRSKPAITLCPGCNSQLCATCHCIKWPGCQAAQLEARLKSLEDRVCNCVIESSFLKRRLDRLEPILEDLCNRVTGLEGCHGAQK